jgi:hypothetical protein
VEATLNTGLGDFTQLFGWLRNEANSILDVPRVIGLGTEVRF